MVYVLITVRTICPYGNFCLRGGGMANEQNLIPLTERGKEEAKRIRQMGQAASVASRRRKRNLREAADLYLSLPPADKRRLNKLARKGLEPDEIDNQMAIIVGLTERAINGDAKAAKVLIELLGEEKDESEQEGVRIIIDV